MLTAAPAGGYRESVHGEQAALAPPPAEGVRVDIHFAGPVIGPKLVGAVEGVNYQDVRADGRVELNIRGEIRTEDGKGIALSATSVAFGKPPVMQLRQNVTLLTSHPEHTWVNTLQIWAVGTVDLVERQIRVTGYAA